MNKARGGPPQRLSRVFLWLLPGDLGAEACEELQREYASMRERRPGVVAWVWLLTHLFRPSTWALARALRRRNRVGQPGASAFSPAGGSTTGISSLDVKLGLRMLVKHPGLSLVSGFGMAVAIAMGALVGAITAAAYAPLPFDEGQAFLRHGSRLYESGSPQESRYVPPCEGRPAVGSKIHLE